MLGNLSLSDNSIFLYVRWIAVLFCFGSAQLLAQSALRSPNFIFYSSSSNLRPAELGLQRLEQLRSAILALHGPDWAPDKTIRIWLPRTEADWFKIANQSSEQGVFLADQRQDWIIANPAAPNFLEVLSHEYIHAVLHRSLPNLPTWFEEGICEYYSTLTLRNKKNRTEVLLGRPPGRRLQSLRGIDTIRLKDFTQGKLTADAYALAWAAAYQLWPDYKVGKQFPDSVPVGPFPIRTKEIDFKAPTLTLSPLSPTEIRELEIEFASRVPAVAIPQGDAASQAESIFLEGLRLSDSGQHQTAAPLLERACTLRPSNSTWWHALALAWIESSQPDKARAALDKAISSATTPQEKAAAEALANRLHR